ncbi:MAG: restriction endonuclease subunit S [Rhodocyclaceae bacterium]|nr:restriction endonuclease subunit S [Rhodocyclaceae bacterium]
MASDAQLTTDVLLGDVATFRSGSVFKPDEQGQRSGDIPFIKVSDLNLPSNSHKIEESNNWLTLQSAKRLGTTIHPAGATVFAKIGVALTYNRRRLLIRDTAIDNNLMSAIPNPSKIRPEFLYHTLRCLDFNEIAKGSALPYINIGDLKGLRVRLPSLPEQEEICSLLDALDDRIDLLRQTNATLEAIAQALFKSWFVDFDPVRAKAEDREPQGVDAATAALFPSEFEDSQLGLIPKGWRVGTLLDLLELQRGFDLPATQRVSGAYPIIAASGPAGTHAEAKVQGPGIVTGRSGVLGKVFLELDDFWPLNTTLWIKNYSACEPCYAYELLRRIDFQQFNAGSAVPTLNRNHVHGLPQFLPPQEAIQAFELIALSMHRRVHANSVQVQLLSEIRDTLLPRLISGKLRLPEAERSVKAAVA